MIDPFKAEVRRIARNRNSARARKKRVRAHRGDACEWCGRAKQAHCSKHIAVFIDAAREMLGLRPMRLDIA